MTCLAIDVVFYAETAEILINAASEEVEDSDFWEGVTRPGNSKTSQHNNEVCVWDDSNLVTHQIWS